MRRPDPALETSRKTRVEAALGLLAAVSALATLVFVAHAFVKSPQNPVAAEIGFEALRVARRLPLYVDPWQGAWEDGAPPARSVGTRRSRTSKRRS